MDKTIFMSKRRWSYWEVAMGGSFFCGWEVWGFRYVRLWGTTDSDTHMQSRNSYMFVQE